MENATNSSFNYDWPNCQSNLEGDLDYQVTMHWHRLTQLQEEADRKQAAKNLSSTPVDEAKLEDLEDLEADLHSRLDQQRSEYQRLQSEADKNPAAKKDTLNNDGNKKMPAADRQQATTLQPRNHQTIPFDRTKAISNKDAEKWLRQHKAKVSLDGVVQANCPIPPQVQQWLENKRREAEALRQLTARPSQRPSARESTANVTSPSSDIMLAPTHIAGWTNTTNQEGGKQDQEEDRKLPAVEHPAFAPRAQTNTSDAGTTIGTIQATATARPIPPQADHPMFSPSNNEMMHKRGISIFEGEVYAPGGINKHLNHHWEKRLADGKLHQPPPPPSTSSDDSDSTPPKRNQKKPAIARKKPAIKRTTGSSVKPQPKQRISLKNRPTTIQAIVFTDPPPNATEKEINKVVSAWFCNNSTRMTKEGIGQCLAPGHTTPQHVQTWM